MAPLKAKGDLAELMVAADLLRRGYKIAIPYGEDWDYDLILSRDGQLERVQVKYAASDGKRHRGPLLLALDDERQGASDKALHSRDDRLDRGV